MSPAAHPSSQSAVYFIGPRPTWGALEQNLSQLIWRLSRLTFSRRCGDVAGFAVVLISARNRSAPTNCGQLWLQDFEDDATVVLQARPLDAGEAQAEAKYRCTCALSGGRHFDQGQDYPVFRTERGPD